jgi:hypothetical protein
MMHRWLSPFLPALIVLCSTLATAAEKPRPTEKRIREILEAARPHLETATALPWPEDLEVEVTDPAGMFTLLSAEFRRDVEVLHPDRPASSRRILADMLARSYARVVRAKYGLLTKKIHVASTALERLPGGVEPDAVLRLIVVHEAVHAIDDAKFELGKLLASAPDAEAHRALRMTIEGRAEHYSGRILALLGIPKSVDEALGVRRDPAERIVRDAGRRFIAALAAKGNAKEVLANPPRTTSVVFHPERYGRDLEIPDASKPLRDAKLGPKAENLSELVQRKNLSARLKPAEVERMFAGFLSGAMVTAADGTQISLTEHSSVAAARAFLAGLMAFEGQAADAEASFATGPLEHPDGRAFAWWAWTRGPRVIYVVGPAGQDPGKRLGSSLAPLPREE